MKRKEVLKSLGAEYKKLENFQLSHPETCGKTGYNAEEAFDSLLADSVKKTEEAKGWVANERLLLHNARLEPG